MDTTVFDSLIAVLARRMDMEKIEKTDDDLCMLEFGDVVVCFRFLHAAGNILIFSDLGHMPETGREAFFRQLLEANHALFETAARPFPSIHRWIWWPCNISVRRKRRTTALSHHRGKFCRRGPTLAREMRPVLRGASSGCGRRQSGGRTSCCGYDASRRRPAIRTSFLLTLRHKGIKHVADTQQSISKGLSGLRPSGDDFRLVGRDGTLRAHGKNGSLVFRRAGPQ